MYNTRLDTPPPASQFRRPWSPDPEDPFPSSRHLPRDDGDESHDPYPSARHTQRREPSDISVEALDLADYARTLNPRYQQAYGPYGGATAFNAYDPYPPSPLVAPRPMRSFPSHDSLPPPSLASAGGTSSSPYTHSTPTTRSRSPRRRPFSLPAPSAGTGRTTRSVRPGEYFPPPHNEPEPEIDIAQFPAWSRAWYHKSKLAGAAGVGAGGGEGAGVFTSYPSFSPPADAHPPNPFDPTFPSHAYTPSPYTDPYDPYAPHIRPSLSSHAGHTDESAARGLFPWSGDAPEDGPRVDEETKEERMRMLEREFGGRGAPGAGAGAGKDGAAPAGLVGSVDERGRLITVGPKKRTSARLAQGAFALCAAIVAIYGALVTKPVGKPPPQGSVQTYLLYVISVLSVLGTVYLFVLRPCCCGGRRTGKAAGPGSGALGGMMVLPVQHLPGGAKANGAKQGGNGKKGARGGDTGSVQVNLIVDPTMFGERGGGRDGESDEDEEDGEWDGTGAGSQWGSSARGRRRRAGAKRRSVFEGLALEERWQAARKEVKRNLWLDIAAFVVWGAEFVYILIGKRCPAGAFNGWCDSYNIATAASCLLVVIFGLNIYFDIKDLHDSRMSPRTRT